MEKHSRTAGAAPVLTRGGDALRRVCMYCARVAVTCPGEGDLWVSLPEDLAADGLPQVTHGVCPECLEEHLVPELEALRARKP